MLALLKIKLSEVLQAVMPLFAAVCLFQVMLVRAPIALFLQFVVGSLLALLGMLLLLAGIDFGILPMGRFIGAELPCFHRSVTSRCTLDVCRVTRLGRTLAAHPSHLKIGGPILPLEAARRNQGTVAAVL
jgi:hypothetical protein